MRRLIALLGALALSLPGASSAQTPGASDSLMNAYMRTLSDSTDAWFGATVAPLDTAGLDSALAVGLANPGRRARTITVRSIALAPAVGFNRVDGARLGLSAASRFVAGTRLRTWAQWANGPNDVLGEVTITRSWRVGTTRARVELGATAGRTTWALHRDTYEPWLSELAAFVNGDDHEHYLRQDGWSARARFVGPRNLAALTWRDQLESARTTTSTWTLFGDGPVVPQNDPAATGRVREANLALVTTLPGTRLRMAYNQWTSSPALGSAFDYRRLRVDMGGDVSIGDHLGLVSQVSYGRLHGEAVPQAAFVLGGVHSLRTLEADPESGTGAVFARSELVLVDDLRRVLRLPLPAWMPLQFGANIATGAIWDHEIGRRFRSDGRDVPDPRDWRSEAGVSLMWRTGIPDPSSRARLECSWPIGVDDRTVTWTVSYQRLLDLLPPVR